MMWSEQPLGATYIGGSRCRFRVWAPFAEKLEVHLVNPGSRYVPLQRDERGYHTATVEDVPPGARYLYRINGGVERPDPASKFQHGVHGASEVFDTEFEWQDSGWFGVPLHDYVIYELHVGTFTPEGTFDAMIPRLAELKDLGITAIELMPISEFPGRRNWGYDGAYPFAAHHAYGGPAGFQRLVEAAHQAGLAVILDVVYNHFGPEGNYISEFGPYFTDRHKTPWGRGLNFDGPDSDHVREYFLQNALYWQTAFHVDALRLDAVHAIIDFSATPFLQELARVTRRQAEKLNRRFHLIAESDLNDARLITPEGMGGYGLDAQWSDDFHHALHVLLTGEQTGYYQDYSGIAPLAKCFRDGYTYTGEYSRYRRRRHGNSTRLNGVRQFVVCAQNHDQIGNRMKGERLSRLVSFEDLKLAAGATLLSPFIPLLFMGEEYGEPAPFQYFVEHGDSQLVEAVRNGRREEFAAFKWQGEVPDPQSEGTFQDSKLNFQLPKEQGSHRLLREFYKELIAARKSIAAIADGKKEKMEVFDYEAEKVLFARIWSRRDEACLVLCFSPKQVSVSIPAPAGNWSVRINSAAQKWDGPDTSLAGQILSDGKLVLTLAPRSVLLLYRDME